MAEPGLASLTLLVGWVLLPWLTGMLLVNRLVPLQGPGRLALWAGLGLAAGMPLAAVSIRATDAIGLALSPWPVLGTLLLMAAVAVLVIELLRVLTRPGPIASQSGPDSRWFDEQAWARVCLLILAVLVVVRFATLLPDLLMRPVFPWDAWKTWAWKARVWFEAGELVPILARDAWLTAEADQFVIDGVSHPDFVSLILLWSALPQEFWNDSLIGLPWLACGLACALILYGLTRHLGAPRVLGWLGVYLFVSLPMVASHIALFGYADLWVTLYFLVFTAGLLLWVSARSWPPLLLMAGAVAAMYFTKDTGIYWLPVAIGAFLATFLRPRVLVGAAVALVIGALVVEMAGIDPASMLSGGRYRVDWQPLLPTLAGMSRHLYVWLDWHLLFYLAPAILLLALLTARTDEAIRALFVLVVMGLTIVLLGFLGTRAAQYAIVGTLFSRILLQMVPALVLLTVMVVWHWLLGQKGHSVGASAHA